MRCGLSRGGTKASAPAPAALCTHTQHFPRDLNSQVRSCRTITAAPIYPPSLFMEKKTFLISRLLLPTSLAAAVLAYVCLYLRDCRVGLKKRETFFSPWNIKISSAQPSDPIMIEKMGGGGGNVLLLVPLSS